MMISLNSLEKRVAVLPANVLKIIASVSMFIDHFGLIFFPTEFVFRMLGRLAFPIFAFFIAEGCHYSKRKVRRFLLIFSLGSIYLIVFKILDGIFYGNIFLTFSVSILMIYALDFLKKAIFGGGGALISILAVIITAAVFVGAYFLMEQMTFDYGFIGALVPVAVSIFDFKDLPVPKALRVLDCRIGRIVTFTLGLLALFLKYEHITVKIFGADVSIYWMYFLVPLLLIFYNGKLGKHKMKYFFYTFYPLHLVLLYGAALLINYLRYWL